MSWGKSSWSSGRRGHWSGDCSGSAGLERGRGEAGRRLQHREHGKQSPAQSCRHGPICRSHAVTTTSCLLWAAQLITRHEERRVRRIFWREKQSFHRALWFMQERWMFRANEMQQLLTTSRWPHKPFLGQEGEGWGFYGTYLWSHPGIPCRLVQTTVLLSQTITWSTISAQPVIVLLDTCS